MWYYIILIFILFYLYSNIFRIRAFFIFVLFSGLSFNGGLCDDSAKTAIVAFRHDSTLASYAAQMLGRR